MPIDDFLATFEELKPKLSESLKKPAHHLYLDFLGAVTNKQQLEIAIFLTDSYSNGSLVLESKY